MENLKWYVLRYYQIEYERKKYESLLPNLDANIYREMSSILKDFVEKKYLRPVKRFYAGPDDVDVRAHGYWLDLNAFELEDKGKRYYRDDCPREVKEEIEKKMREISESLSI